MKKLLLLFLLSFIVIFSFAQTTFPTYQPIGNSVTLWDQKGAVRGTKGLIVGDYTDTTAANGAGNYIKFYAAAQIFTTSDDQIWVRDATATRWINVTTGFSPTPTCGLQSGTGIVHYDSLLIFSVTAANYSLCCDSVPRTSAADSILLPPADPSNPVYVAIILDANGVNYVRGVPAANPSLPQLTNCQIALTYVLINAGDVVPANVSVTTIYDENYTSEWDSVTTSTLVMDTANTTFPVHLSKDIDVTSYGTGGYMEFWTANTVDLNNYGILKFYVRLKGVATIRFSLTWYLDGVQQTFSAVPLVISGITGVYQVMAVPISAFRILNNSSVNKLRIQVFGTQGFYLDWIQLQSGIIPSSPIDNGFTTLNVGNLDSLFNSTVTFPIGQPVVIFTKKIVPAYTALVRPYNTNGPFEWNKINLATPIITGLLPVTNIAPGNANDILTTIGGISTWVPSAGGYDTTITFNWLRSYPGTVRDSIAFGSPYLDSALLTFDTYVGLDNKFLKIMQDDEILFLLDPAGFSAFLRAYDGTSESVIGTEADLVNSSLFFTLKSKNGADSVWIVGNGQNKKITFIADSLLFKSTLAGAVTGYVWTLKDAATGSGYWKVAGGGAVTTLYTGNGTLAGNRIVDLGGNSLRFIDGAETLIDIGSNYPYSTDIRAKSSTVGSAATLSLEADPLDVSRFYLFSSEAGNNVIINGDASAQTITLTAGTKIIMEETAGNVGIGTSSPSIYSKLHVVGTSFGLVSGILVTGNEIGIQANATPLSSGAAVVGNTDGPNGYGAVFTMSYGTTEVLPVLLLKRNSGSTTASGFGGSIDYDNQNSNGTSGVTNQLISILTDPTEATRTSQFIITGVNNAVTGDILTLNGNKSIQANGYGSGTFTGTPTYSLAVDASGNLIERSAGVVASNRLTGQTGTASLTAYTVGASDASFLVSANILVTTATLHSFTATVTYTDEGNTSRTLTLNFSTIAGAITPTIANAGGALPYEGIPLHIRCKASTTITIATTGTFTTVTYNFEQVINKLN